MLFVILDCCYNFVVHLYKDKKNKDSDFHSDLTKKNSEGFYMEEIAC